MASLSRCRDAFLVVVAASLPSGLSGINVDPYFVMTGRHFSFIVDDNNAKATGRNNYGQLGIGSTEDQNRPVGVDLPFDDAQVDEIAAGAFHTLFLTSSGNAYVAGWNRFGQLGLGIASKNPFEATPRKVELGDVVVTGVAAGYAHSLFLLDSGAVMATGLNSAGQLGDGTKISQSEAVAVSTADMTDRVVKVAAGYDFSYFLTEAGEAWATGQNLGGQLGDGTKVTRLVPVRTIGGVSAFSAGESHGLFLMTDLSVRSTGANFDGQLGDGTTEKKDTPTDIGEAGSRIVSAGGDSSCLVNGVHRNLLCMGSNRDGQLGFGEDSNKLTPTSVPVSDSMEVVAVADTHSMFVAHPGDVFITGSNSYGELGDSSTNPKNSPEVLLRFSFNLTTRTSTTTATTTMSTVTNTTTTPFVEGTRTIRSDPEAEDFLMWGIAIAVGMATLVVNVVCQQRAAAQLEEDDEDGPDGTASRDVELSRQEP